MNSILSIDEPFKIFVGDPTVNKIMIGFPEKGMATLAEGTSLGEIEYTGGDETFPNYWEAWGRRVINGKLEADENKIEVTNQKYVGEIEFLEPSNRLGYPIYCRYIRGQFSLDYQYQVTRLGLKDKEKDEENMFTILARGEHKIDPAKDASFALAIKVHQMNSSNTMKVGSRQNTIYKEITPFETTKTNVKALNVGFEATRIIKENDNNFEKLKILHTVLSAEKEIRYDVSDPSTLLDSLMIFAHDFPEDVLRLVARYKEQTSALIDKCKSYNVFDTTKNGQIGFGGANKGLLLSDIEKGYGKGDDMLQYIFDKCLEPKVYEAINKLYEYCSKNIK